MYKTHYVAYISGQRLGLHIFISELNYNTFFLDRMIEIKIHHLNNL